MKNRRSQAMCNGNVRAYLILQLIKWWCYCSKQSYYAVFEWGVLKYNDMLETCSYWMLLKIDAYKRDKLILSIFCVSDLLMTVNYRNLCFFKENFFVFHKTFFCIELDELSMFVHVQYFHVLNWRLIFPS